MDSQRKTPEFMLASAHHLKRYLFENEYAEEMQCMYCGFVTWPVFSEEEAIQAIKELGGTPGVCMMRIKNV